MNKRIKKKLQKRFWCRHYREYKAVKHYVLHEQEFSKLMHVMDTVIDERIGELAKKFSDYLVSKDLIRDLLYMKPGECPCDPDMGVDVGALSHYISSSNVRKVKIIERIRDGHFSQEKEECKRPANDFDVIIQEKQVRR